MTTSIMKRKRADKSAKKVQGLSHSKAKRILTAQHLSFMTEEQQKPIQKTYPCPHSNLSPAMRDTVKERDPDLDPQPGLAR